MSYPLHVFRFHVGFRDARAAGDSDETVPLCDGAFSECTGLEVNMAPFVVTEGGHNHGPHQRAGKVTFGTVVLKRGITTTQHLYKWFELVSAGAYAYRLTATVTLQDTDGNPVLAWELKRALPVKLRVPGLNASGTDVGVEELHLAHEGLELVRSGEAGDV